MGKDPSGLGHWSWFCLQGHTQQSLRIVTVYQPCMSECTKLKSVYAQHLCYLNSINDHLCPRLAFLRDLQSACQAWKAAGDRLLIVGDFNGDVRGQELQSFFSALEMREIFMTEHPNQPTLSTFTRSTQMGRSPINDVWLSHGVSIQACSWTAFLDSPGNHHAAIVDFDIVQVLGQPCVQVCHTCASSGLHPTSHQGPVCGPPLRFPGMAPLPSKALQTVYIFRSKHP